MFEAVHCHLGRNQQNGTTGGHHEAGYVRPPRLVALPITTLGADHDQVRVSCLLRKMLCQGKDGGVHPPFRPPLELCDSVAEFELACLDVPRDLLAVFVKQDC